MMAKRTGRLAAGDELCHEACCADANGGYGGGGEPTVPAESFLGTLHANVDNRALDDRAFRQFVRDSLPIVVYPRPDRRIEDAVPAAAPR